MSFKSSNWYSLNQKGLIDSFVGANGTSLWSSCKSSGYSRSTMKPDGLSSVVSRIFCRLVIVSVSKFPRSSGKILHDSSKQVVCIHHYTETMLLVRVKTVGKIFIIGLKKLFCKHRRHTTSHQVFHKN